MTKYKINIPVILVALLVLFVLIGSFVYINKTISVSAKTVTASDWKAGNIIDDNTFYNGNDMSVDQIQNFMNDFLDGKLDGKNGTCDTWGVQRSELGGGTRAQYGASQGYPAPFICLKDYSENGVSSAQIIKDAATNNGVSARALLVMIQKESPGPLLTDVWPFPRQYRNAMGFGCPDTAPCDPQYDGFTKQVNHAARQFILYKNSPNSYRHKAGQNNNVLFNPNSACGSSTVYISSIATAGLYNYTPYQPNQAALNNMYGTGDDCSAYGNRNFWRMFNDWFGDTSSYDTSTPHPDGTIVNIDNAIYLISNGTRKHIGGGAIFGSYRYAWNKVKTSTSGDRQLSISSPIYNLNPDRLYRTNTGVYAIITEGGSTYKQLISYQSFMSLKYSWEDTVPVDVSLLPANNYPVVYNEDKHRNGDLISYQGRVYLIDHNTRRYVSGPIYNSYNWPWVTVMPATQKDLNYPEGERTLYNEGTVLFDGSGIYAVKLPPSGYEIKHPIGPWECFALSFKYSLNDTLRVNNNELPVATGGRITCY